MQRMSRTAGTPGAQGGGAAARPPHTPSGTRHACFRQTQVASTLRLAVTRALLDDPRDLVPRQLTRTARTAAWVALARPGRQDGTATAARDATPNVDVCLQALCKGASLRSPRGLCCFVRGAHLPADGVRVPPPRAARCRVAVRLAQLERSARGALRERRVLLLQRLVQARLRALGAAQRRLSLVWGLVQGLHRAGRRGSF